MQVRHTNLAHTVWDFRNSETRKCDPDGTSLKPAVDIWEPVLADPLPPMQFAKLLS